MKRLITIFLSILFSSVIISCNDTIVNNSLSGLLYTNNNSTDVEIESMGRHFVRQGSGNGVIGRWVLTMDQYNETELVYKNDGSMNYYQVYLGHDSFGNPKREYRTSLNGNYSLFEINGDDIIDTSIRWYSGDLYDGKKQIFVSDNYLIIRKYSGPQVDYVLLNSGVEITWGRNDVFGLIIDCYEPYSNLHSQIKDQNLSGLNTIFKPLPSGLKRIHIKLYSKKFWYFPEGEYYYNEAWVDIQ
jgi:hypothetical protein